jgi:hypothetical protein
VRAIVSVSVGVLALVVVLGSRPSRQAGPDGEVRRVQTHLAGALELLRSAPMDGLSSEQRAARQETIAWLEEYRAAGVFPHNHVDSGARVPVFVDPHGTPCAVGYLLLRSGAHALVEDVVREANLVRVPELAGDPRLAEWLEERGLTLAEAARIQPEYDGFPGEREPEPSTYASETVGVSIATAAVAAYAALAESNGSASNWPGFLGLATLAGHGTFAVLGLRNEVAEWQPVTNVVGMMVSAAVVAVRFGRGDTERSAVTVFPTGIGTGVGVAASLKLPQQ